MPIEFLNFQNFGAEKAFINPLANIIAVFINLISIFLDFTNLRNQ